MKEKTKRSRSVGVVVSLIFAVCAVLGLVWMIASGNVELALETVIRWGEDGTMDNFEQVMVDHVIPLFIGIGVAAGGAIAALLPTINKLKEAKKQMDAGTEQAVSTYGERKAMNEQMETFMKKQRAENEALRREQRERLDAMEMAQRDSLASDRAAIRRIEGKLDGLRSMELTAYDASSELVKKGAASRIREICAETEGAEELSGVEGGEGCEDGRDDGQAAEDTETH